MDLQKLLELVDQMTQTGATPQEFAPAGPPAPPTSPAAVPPPPPANPATVPALSGGRGIPGAFGAAAAIPWLLMPTSTVSESQEEAQMNEILRLAGIMKPAASMKSDVSHSAYEISPAVKQSLEKIKFAAPTDKDSSRSKAEIKSLKQQPQDSMEARINQLEKERALLKKQMGYGSEPQGTIEDRVNQMEKERALLKKQMSTNPSPIQSIEELRRIRKMLESK